MGDWRHFRTDMLETNDMSNQEEHDRLLQKEWRERIIPHLHEDEWIRIYQVPKQTDNIFLAICAGSVPNKHIKSLLQSENWDINPRNSRPDVYIESDEHGDIHLFEYDRFGFNSFGVEPLVIVQDFDGLRPEFVQLSEEFRLYHNLYFDNDACAYFKFDQGGNETKVVDFSSECIVARRKELRQFIAAKGMSLVIYFERRYLSQYKLEEVVLKKQYTKEKSDDYVFRFNVFETRSAHAGTVAFSRLYGKKIITGLPHEKCGIWPYVDTEYAPERFIIGVDENDEYILGDSAPYNLRNTITGSQRLPDEVERLYLTPVFFKPSVLNKYYADTDKYTVSTAHLHCGSKWGMWVSTIHPEFVCVNLGDLGRDLPFSEHKHWRDHNVAPPGTLRNLQSGETNLHWDREAVNSALVFQNEYKKFCNDWKDHFGWELLKPLRKKEDKVRYYRLRRPLTNDLSDLHDAVVTLAILLNESINVRELKRRITNFEPKENDGKEKKSLAILNEYLDQCRFLDSTEFIEYLRNLQSLRSTSVHRKGAEYQKVKEAFCLESKHVSTVADEIFDKLTSFLRLLYSLILRHPNPPSPVHKE